MRLSERCKVKFIAWIKDNSQNLNIQSCLEECEATLDKEHDNIYELAGRHTNSGKPETFLILPKDIEED